ncbi:TPA: restriction endonuclease subunit S [Escherichia coli]
MSVDTLRETFHINRISTSDLQDFLTAQTYRPEITKAKNHILSLKNCSLQAVCTKPIQQGKSPKYAEKGLKCIKPKNTNDMLVSIDDIDWIDSSTKDQIQKQKLGYGDIVITRSGSGTIGRASIYCYNEEAYTNDHLFIVRPDKADSHYICSFLNSFHGQRLLEAGVSGSTGQLNLSNEHIKSIPLFRPDDKAQKYIGDKVRQAEQLRAWAKRLALSIEDLLTSSDDYLSACRTPEKKITRPQLSDLSNRLDPKYYGNKAIAVHRFTRKTGTPLAALIKSVANGFEERSFIENGLAYITVSEVSSGRLDAQSAPKISNSIDVPQKAVIHETCVLVVRTGSIGTAVKVHALDKGCAISSHLIRLEFEDEETAAAVAVFLNSSAGKVLLHKISYGAVQPQIGQEELLALNIPEYVLNEKTQCLALLNSYELAIRSSKSLTVSAKNLVEALIEGQLTEQQLIQAQQALEDGDNSFDQAILSKLSAEGYAIEGATPLFSDVDELYSLLEEAAQAEAEE